MIIFNNRIKIWGYAFISQNIVPLNNRTKKELNDQFHTSLGYTGYWMFTICVSVVKRRIYSVKSEANTYDTNTHETRYPFGALEHQ